MSHATSTRRNLLALALSGLLALSALSMFVSPVAATNVANADQFREAWAEPAETLITLTANIALTCDAEGDTGVVRNSATAIVVDGAGYSITNSCASDALFPLANQDALVQDGIGLVTLRNLTLVGNVESGDGLNTVGAAVVEAGSVVTGHGNDGVDTQLDATIVGSTVSNNGNNGVESEVNVTVSGGSTISGNGDFGIEADGNVTVSGSTISDNDDSGIEAGGDVIVNGASTLSNNEGNGIDAGGEVSVTGSTLSSNENTAIDASGDVTVTGSTISDSETECGYGIRTNGDASVDDSTITGNADSGIRASNVTVIDSDVSGNGVEGGCDGEGIRADGNVSVTDSTVNNNSDDSVGIRAAGDATILRSTVANNGNDGGGGVRADQAFVTDSTISNNAGEGIDALTATVSGSTFDANSQRAILADSATVTNSTITGHENTAGIEVDADVTATYLTMSGNWINIQSGAPQTIHLFGSVLIDAESANCVGAVEDEGFNFVDDDSCGSIVQNLTPPQLGALGNNGGPTQTRLPADTSPLVDAIPLASCQVGLTDDQRGLLRPSDGDDDGTIGCDMGAVEVQGAIVPTAAPTAAPTTAPTTAPTGTAAPTASELPDTTIGDGSVVVTGMVAAMLILLLISASALRTATARHRR